MMQKTSLSLCINIHTSISAVDRSLSVLLQAAIFWLQNKHIVVILNDYTMGGQEKM